MDYNLGGTSRTLVGNWAEDRRLQDLGQSARVAGRAARFLDTGGRVLPSHGPVAATAPSTWRSEAAAAAESATLAAPAFADDGLGPRARRDAAAVATDAHAFASTLLAPRREEAPVSTTSGSSYLRYDSSAYRPPVRRPQLGESGAGGAGGGGGGASASSGGDGGLGATSSPVTIYTMRLPHGTFPASPLASAARPFSKSTAFTNPIDVSGRHFAQVSSPALWVLV